MCFCFIFWFACRSHPMSFVAYYWKLLSLSLQNHRNSVGWRTGRSKKWEEAERILGQLDHKIYIYIKVCRIIQLLVLLCQSKRQQQHTKKNVFSCRAYVWSGSIWRGHVLIIEKRKRSVVRQQENFCDFIRQVNSNTEHKIDPILISHLKSRYYQFNLSFKIDNNYVELHGL